MLHLFFLISLLLYMPKAIVTGAAGHIGYHVTKVLLAKHYDVHLLVRSINTNII